jgi:hypothetical protein
VAAIEAAQRARVPAVATVRDYWPVCYWSDLIAHTREGLDAAPGMHAAQHDGCIQPRAGRAVAAGAADDSLHAREPRREAHGARARRRRDRRQPADRADLVERAPELARHAIECIPNPVDVDARCASARGRAEARSSAIGWRSGTAPYALYLANWRPTRDEHLVDVVTQADLDWPLVDRRRRPDRAGLERAARRRAGDRVQGLGGQGRRPRGCSPTRRC